MSKEKDELLLLVKQLDKIITSDRAEVKEAFRELLIMSTLIADGNVTGPLTQLTRDMDDLKHRVRRNEQEIDRVRTSNRDRHLYGQWDTSSMYGRYTTEKTRAEMIDKMQGWCNEIYSSPDNNKDDNT